MNVSNLFAKNKSKKYQTPTKMINEPTITIDLTYLHTVTGGDRLFEKTLLEGAVADIQLKIDEMQSAWDREDASTIRSNAHSLKSLTAIAGLPQIEHWSKIIDQLFADGIFHSKPKESINSIINGWGLAKPKLQRLLATY